MNITANQIAKVVAELSSGLQGAFFNKILQMDEDEWIFILRKNSQKWPLLISVSPQNSRIHLLFESPKSGLELKPFAKLIKKIVTGGALTGIEQIHKDRIVKLNFRSKNGEWSIVVELMGSHGDILLLNSEGKIAASALGRKFRNKPGVLYIPPEPPGPDRIPLTDSSASHSAVEIASGQSFPFNRKVDDEYLEPALQERMSRAKAKALAPVKAALKKIKKRLKVMEKKKKELMGYKEYKKMGDILQLNYNKIRKGAAFLSATDLAHPERGEIKIPLDPAKSPAQNVQAFYKLHKKYVKGTLRIDEQLTKLAAEQIENNNKISAIELAENIGEVEPYIPPPKKKTGSSAKQKGGKATSGPRRFVSSEGYLVLVGRNNRDNDEITFKIANGRDLWLHVSDYPGSHVLARLPKGLKNIPRATLMESAMLALKYSKASKAGRGNVTYCLAKNVRKPKGASPGKALITGEKSIMVKIDPQTVKAMKDRVAEA